MAPRPIPDTSRYLACLISFRCLPSDHVFEQFTHSNRVLICLIFGLWSRNCKKNCWPVENHGNNAVVWTQHDMLVQDTIGLRSCDCKEPCISMIRIMFISNHLVTPYDLWMGASSSCKRPLPSKGTSAPKPCQQNAPHSVTKPLDHHWCPANTFAFQVVRYHRFVMGSSRLIQTQTVHFSIYVQHTPTWPATQPRSVTL